MRHGTRILWLGLAALGIAMAPAAADSYPSRPITVIVPAAAGGSTDVLARIIGQSMSKTLGQSLIVENVGGAGGTIGMARAAKAAPDGYTLAFGNLGHLAANVAIYPNLSFDPRKDFVPIGVVAEVPMVLATSAKSNMGTLSAFLASLKAKPGQLNIGTSGPGSTGHLAPTLFLKQTGSEATLVSYRGAAPAILDLSSGAIDAVFDQTVTMIAVYNGKSAHTIAVTGPARIPQMPDVPTFAEAGLPQFDMVVWQGLVAPGGVSDAIRDRLAKALATALEDPEVLRRFADLAANAPAPAGRGPQAMAERIRGDVALWSETLR